MQNYHTSWSVFPIGITKVPFGSPSDYRGWSGWSAHSQMLPHLGQSALFNGANFSWSPDQAGLYGTGPGPRINSTVVETLVGVFLCPSDPFAGIDSQNSYHASMGATTKTNPTKSTGLFAKYTSTSLANCRDGSSNTIAYSEALVGSTTGQTNYRGNVVIGVEDPTPSAKLYDASSDPTAIDQACVNCVNAFASGQSIFFDRGRMWAVGRVGFTLFNTVVTPNDPQFPLNGCRLNVQAYYSSDSQNITPATSAHRNGVNTLMADGSVRFITDSISVATWRALGTKAKGDIADLDN
jgi:prepilin-type processing-associated H-X9-DG protein